MDGYNRFGKKSHWMIDGWLKLLLLEKMNDRSLLLSANEKTHYFKKWTTGSGVLNKIYFI